MKITENRLKIIERLIEGVTPQNVAWMYETPLSTVYQIKNTFLEAYYRLKKHVPDPDQLNFPFMHQYNLKEHNRRKSERDEGEAD